MKKSIRALYIKRHDKEEGGQHFSFVKPTPANHPGFKLTQQKISSFSTKSVGLKASCHFLSQTTLEAPNPSKGEQSVKRTGVHSKGC